MFAYYIIFVYIIQESFRFKLNTTFCASFVFWGRFFQYFVYVETKFAESFFLKSIIYYPGGK
jgi:hypothetical protein